MSKHNYSQYSKKNNNHKPKVAAVDESPVEIKMESVEPAVVIGPIEVIEPAVAPETVIGIIANCNKLNIRVKPATDAEVLVVLDAGSKIEIDPARSTNDWFKITTVDGIKGYCMRKFVNAKL